MPRSKTSIMLDGDLVARGAKVLKMDVISDVLEYCVQEVVRRASLKDLADSLGKEGAQDAAAKKKSSGVIVDSDVWIKASSGTDAGYTDRLRAIIRTGDVLGHESVHLKLTLTAPGNVNKSVLDRYSDLPQAVALPKQALLTFITNHKLGDKGVSLEAVHVIASAYTMGAKLWTEDEQARAIATKLGCAYNATKDGAP